MNDSIVLDDFDRLGIPPADAALAVAVYTKLQQHYPGHNWRVNADHEQGIVTVHLQYFDARRTNALWGFRIKIARLNSDPDMRSVVRAGGELLERFDLSRAAGKVDFETRLRAIEHGLDLTL